MFFMFDHDERVLRFLVFGISAGTPREAASGKSNFRSRGSWTEVAVTSHLAVEPYDELGIMHISKEGRLVNQLAPQLVTSPCHEPQGNELDWHEPTIGKNYARKVKVADQRNTNILPLICGMLDTRGSSNLTFVAPKLQPYTGSQFRRLPVPGYPAIDPIYSLWTVPASKNVPHDCSNRNMATTKDNQIIPDRVLAVVTKHSGNIHS
ncbi:hypothetical protein BKA70DRAFT_1242269 [Coprinopsis sp. MPI-PUGE-AT-0042]|nr:hypothetical protein BKA70DRAFT_1242269 [Coprinopsis sp. MPI-PUGE-AT-0042]